MLSRYEVEAVLCTRLFFCCIFWSWIFNLCPAARSGDRVAAGSPIARVAEVGHHLPGLCAFIFAGRRLERSHGAPGRSACAWREHSDAHADPPLRTGEEEGLAREPVRGQRLLRDR